MRKLLPVLWTCLLVLAGCESGRQGVAFVREADGDIGNPIPGVALTFIAEDGSGVHRVTTGVEGEYEMPLESGRYVVTATHSNYADYSTSPGFVVVESGGMESFNFFLREPMATTVFVVRHAEKIHPDSNAAETPLSGEGMARAVALERVLDEVGVTGLFSTPTVRTEGTLGPLAEKFGLDIVNYTNPEGLVEDVMANHRGDVVAVAGHSNTVGQVAAAFGGQIEQGSIGDYDNLYMVTVPENGDVSVVNLQYGEDTAPDTPKTQVASTTLLLLESDPAGAGGQGTRYEHALRNAGVTALVSEPGLGTLDALSNSTGLPVQPLSGDVATAVGDVAAQHSGGVLAVALGSAGLASALESWGAPPPVSFNGDVGPLVVVTMLADGPLVRYLRY